MRAAYANCAERGRAISNRLLLRRFSAFSNPCSPIFPQTSLSSFPSSPRRALEGPTSLSSAPVSLRAPLSNSRPGDPARYRDAHDKRQFSRFQSLPVWAISNFSSLRVFERDDPIASIEIVPEAALDPETTDAKAERLIRKGDPAGLTDALRVKQEFEKALTQDSKPTT
jgi:hypothetical protein